MENSLLEIELVHYIVILMWIPLVLQVKATTPARVKWFIIIFFIIAWGSIELQILFKIAIMSYNFSMICEPNCSFAYLWKGAFNDIYYFHTANLFWKIIFNSLHFWIIILLAGISIEVAMKKMNKNDDTCCEKIQNFLSEILDEIKKTNYNKS